MDASGLLVAGVVSIRAAGRSVDPPGAYPIRERGQLYAARISHIREINDMKVDLTYLKRKAHKGGLQAQLACRFRAVGLLIERRQHSPSVGFRFLLKGLRKK